MSLMAAAQRIRMKTIIAALVVALVSILGWLTNTPWRDHPPASEDSPINLYAVAAGGDDRLFCDDPSHPCTLKGSLKDAMTMLDNWKGIKPVVVNVAPGVYSEPLEIIQPSHRSTGSFNVRGR